MVLPVYHTWCALTGTTRDDVGGQLATGAANVDRQDRHAVLEPRQQTDQNVTADSVWNLRQHRFAGAASLIAVTHADNAVCDEVAEKRHGEVLRRLPRNADVATDVWKQSDRKQSHWSRRI